MSDSIKPSKELKRMFSSIAKSYDKMNHVMSLGSDIGWRAAAAKECIAGKQTLNVLDVATGTGDLALAIAKEAERREKKVRIMGVDFNEDMLEIARQKIRRNDEPNIKLAVGNALSLNLEDNTYDVVTSGFALRNFDNLKSFVEESYRVLKPGGKIVYLDVAKPDASLNHIFQFYYFKIVPVVVASMDYNPEAYQYLFNSLWVFDKKRALELVKKAGFQNAKIKSLTFGAAFIITATKPKEKAK